MQLDPNIIKAKRQERGWSQENLASESRLGVRTVQRVETDGRASPRTSRKLAAALACAPADLLPAQSQGNQLVEQARLFRWSVGAVSVVLALLGLSMVQRAMADPIMLDVGLSLDDVVLAEGSLLVAQGKQGEMRVEEQLRIVIRPNLRKDNQVYLSTQVYEWYDGEFLLVDEPELMVANHKEAEFRLTTPLGHALRVTLLPHVSQASE